ncbi:hypothetical protein DYB28_009932, partial [Aphanomyces astaci]
SCLAHLGSNLADAIVSHELDYDRKTPLSIVLFANSTEVIQSMASKKAAHAAIHATLVNLVKRCPRRNMLVLENLHLVPQAWLPVLDVFLLPLSGKVATTKDDSTQQTTTSGLLDTLPTVFVFLFETHTSPIAADGQHWKEYLDGKWQFPGKSLFAPLCDSNSELDPGVEFTPQALIGRLGHGMVVTRTSAPTCVVLLAPETIRSSNSVAAAVLISVTVVAVVIALGAWWVARSRRSHGAKHTPPVVHTPRVCDQRFDDEDEVTFIPHTSHDTRRDVTATTTSSRSCIESVSADRSDDRVSHDTHADTTPSPVSVAAPSVSHAHNVASHVTESHPTPPSAKPRRKKPTLAPVRSISK